MSSAKALKLIPVELYKKLLAIHVQQGQPTVTETVSSVVVEEEADGERQDSIDSILQMLPKSYRRKARVILEAGEIPFHPKTLRVQYSDGEVGSHVMDLLQYVLAPKFIQTKQKSTPIDLDKFIELLKSKPVIPSSVYSHAKKSRKPKKTIDWLTL